MSPKREPVLMTTTLWDFPSQQYGDESQGSKEYEGATPAYLIWNLLHRYTQPKDLVVDPMAGSGTTLDVARELGRRALGYDVHPSRKDIFNCDARKLPLQDAKADFVFIDPPYSTHIDYGPDPRCIGKLDAGGTEYYEAMDAVIAEIHRILRPDRRMALYVCDSFRKGKPFCPIGLELFDRLRRRFEVVDIVAVVRHNRTLKRRHWHTSAVEGNYFLRGFNYLFIMRKPAAVKERPAQGKRGMPGRRGRPAGPPPRTA
jgi:DNA modification methylase